MVSCSSRLRSSCDAAGSRCGATGTECGAYSVKRSDVTR